MVKVFKDSEDIAQFIGGLLVKDMAITGEDNYCVSLAGGSTPKAIYDYLADTYSETIHWHKIKFFWGDERCVPPSDNESNYKMAMEHMLNRVPVLSDQVFRIIGENDPSLEAIRYSNMVGKHLHRHGSTPSFNLMFLGLGDDGHTASIFPDQLNLFKVPQLFYAATHPVSRQVRITATGRLINHAKKLVFIVTGKSKAGVVSNILQEKAGYEQLPASLVRPENGELFWLLDEAAAANLNPSMYS